MNEHWKPEIGKAVFVNLLLSGTQVSKVLDVQENVMSIVYSS